MPVPVPVPPRVPVPGLPVPPPAPPPRPPKAPVVCGPALGMDPVCVVATVSMAYAAGPVSPATSAHTTGTAASPRRRRAPALPSGPASRDPPSAASRDPPSAASRDPPSAASRDPPSAASRGPARIDAAAATPARMITQRSHGNHDADRLSSSSAHQTVTPTVAAATSRPNHPSRRSHSAIAPTLTRAAIAGARATM